MRIRTPELAITTNFHQSLAASWAILIISVSLHINHVNLLYYLDQSRDNLEVLIDLLQARYIISKTFLYPGTSYAQM